MGAAVVAVDFLLLPDATMVERATAANDRLRAVYPDGYALDAEHTPHITITQGYFPTDSLDEIYAECESFLDGHSILSWPLTAFRYSYLALDVVGLAGIDVRPSAELVALQRGLLDVLAPFTAAGGTEDAFVQTEHDPEINDATIAYVGLFASLAAGPHFNPHVTVGIAGKDDLDQMVAEPFAEFTFSAVGAAAYRLANFGTAAKQLHTWKLSS